MPVGRLFGGGSVLGIELTPSQIKIVEALPGARVKVLHAVTAGYFRGDQATVAGQLRNVVKQEGFRSKSAYVAVTGPTVVHGLIALPILKGPEMQVVVDREIRKLSSLPAGDLSAGFEIVGETAERDARKVQVLMAGASRAAVSQTIGLVQAAGLKVIGASVVPVALYHAMRLVLAGDEATLAHLKLGQETSYIAIMRGGQLQFSREIPLGLRGSEGGTGFADRLIAEVRRTALYYRQNFRGEEIRRIVISGDEPDLRRFTGPILDELGIEVSIYDPTPSLDLESLKDGAIKFRETAHHFAVPLGLVWSPPKGKGAVNILPREVARKSTVRFQRVTAMAAGVLLLVGLAIAYFWIEGQLQQRRERISALTSQAQALEPQVQQIQEEVRLREIQRVRLAFVTGMTQQGPVMAKALQEFSLLIPDEMLFRNVKVAKLPDKWQLTIDGEVVEQDAPRAQAIFNRFFSELRASSFFYEAGLMQPLQVSTFEDTGSANLPAPPAVAVTPVPATVPSTPQPRLGGSTPSNVVRIPVPQRATAAEPQTGGVRRSKVEFRLGVSIASM